MEYQNQIPIRTHPPLQRLLEFHSLIRIIKSFIFPFDASSASSASKHTPCSPVSSKRRAKKEEEEKRSRSLNVHPDLYTLFLPPLPPIIPLSFLLFPGSVNFAAVFFEAYRINCIVAPRWGLNFA